VRIEDLSRSDGLVLRSTTQRLSADGIARSRLLPPGTLIMSIAATVGLPIITAFRTCIHDGFVALESLKKVDQTYLLYVLKSQESQLQSAEQTGSQANINTDIVRGIVVDLPPEPEQKKIAEALRDTDRQIAIVEQLIRKKEAIKQGMMQQLLAGTVRLQGFTKAWSTHRLSQLGPFLKGRGIKREDVRAAGVPCVRYGELYTTYRIYTSSTVSFVTEAIAADALALQQGDLLFAGSGETREEIGTCVAFTGTRPTVAGGDIIVLRAREVNPIFLSALLNTPRVAAQKARLGQGDAVVHISSGALGSIELYLPPRDEQDAIADVFISADDEIRRLEDGLAKIRLIKQGMMQELLTARTRLSYAQRITA
jgi:type I restriction enzyme S subunit